MNLFETEQMYKNGVIDKHTYIKRMYEKNHDILFQYSDFIKNRDIQKIEISTDSVIMTSKEHGIKMRFKRYDEGLVPVTILNFGFYEKEDLDMVFRLLKDGDTFFDIGANTGWYSLCASKIKKDVEIYAFEPIPATFGDLSKNVQINQMTNINTYNFGFSNEKKELIFYYYKEGSGNASSALMYDTRDNEEIKCKVDTLDNFVQEKKIGKIDFIKCDVEGAELFVFQGGAKTIEKFKPIIFTEMLRKWSAKFDYHPNKIISLFSDINYKCYFIEDGALKEIVSMTEETVKTNFFFLHAAKHKNIIEELRIG